jgi:Kef-type K+ transport system membrane component KefB
VNADAALLPDAGPLLILAVVLVIGTALGWLAQRLRLPGITGQIVAGVAIGAAGLHLFEEVDIGELQPLTHFALALVGVTVGAHLNLRRLRNAWRRLALLLLFESLVTPIAVALAVAWLPGADPRLTLLLAPLAISTAPATVVALVRESRARGVFVKTLIAAVAINNIMCIVLFEFARYAARLGVVDPGPGGGLGEFASSLAEPASQLVLTMGLGAAAAVATHLATLRVVRPDRLTTVSLISLLLTYGAASYLQLSPLLACMTLGAVQTNVSPSRDMIVDSVFHNFEPVILCIFFTLAGMHLSFEHAAQYGLVATAFLAARALGKYVASDLSLRLAGATDTLRRSLRIGLLPQAGVAIGLVILIQDDPGFSDIQELFAAPRRLPAGREHHGGIARGHHGGRDLAAHRSAGVVSRASAVLPGAHARVGTRARAAGLDRARRRTGRAARRAPRGPADARRDGHQ